jgi:hypothetical protein
MPQDFLQLDASCLNNLQDHKLIIPTSLIAKGIGMLCSDGSNIRTCSSMATQQTYINIHDSQAPCSNSHAIHVDKLK